MLQNHFFVSCSPIWAFFDQCMVQIDHLLWYTIPFWSHQMHSIVFLPKRFGLVVDVDGYPESTHDLLRFGFSKYIHFSSPVTIRCKKNFLSCRESKTSYTIFRFSICCSDDVVPIFLPSESFPWHADDQKWFRDQHLTSLPFVVEFVYPLRPTMSAIPSLGIFWLARAFFVF